MTVAVYGRASCVACEYTKKQLDGRKIPYEYFDVDTDSDAKLTVEEFGNTVLPLVIHTEGPHVVDRWNGFKIDKIRGLQHR